MATRASGAPALPAPDERPQPPWPGRTVVAGPRALFVRRAGDPAAPPVVLVHGLGGNSTNWTDLMALLAPAADVHAPDLPGHGRSGPPVDGRYPLDLHVRAVADYIETLGRGPVHLAGNSMGGAVVVRLAAERPDLVRTLTLVSPALPQYDPRRAHPRLTLLLVPGVTALMTRYRSRVPAERYVDQVLELCVADPASYPPERRAEGIAEVERRRALPWAVPALVGSLRGLVRAYLEPGRRNLWRQAAAVPVPVLVVAGRQDRVVPVAVAQRTASVFRDVRLVVLDRVGHVAQVERPAVVAELIREHASLSEPAGRPQAAG